MNKRNIMKTAKKQHKQQRQGNIAEAQTPAFCVSMFKFPAIELHVEQIWKILLHNVINCIIKNCIISIHLKQF